MGPKSSRFDYENYPICLQKIKNEKNNVVTFCGHKLGKAGIDKMLEGEGKGKSVSKSSTKVDERMLRCISEESSENLINPAEDEEDRACPICLELMKNKNKIVTPCGHKFCKDCISRWLDKGGGGGKRKCPICNYKISRDFLKTASASKSFTEVYNPYVIIPPELPGFNYRIPADKAYPNCSQKINNENNTVIKDDFFSLLKSTNNKKDHSHYTSKKPSQNSFFPTAEVCFPVSSITDENYVYPICQEGGGKGKFSIYNNTEPLYKSNSESNTKVKDHSRISKMSSQNVFPTEKFLYPTLPPLLLPYPICLNDNTIQNNTKTNPCSHISINSSPTAVFPGKTGNTSVFGQQVGPQIQSFFGSPTAATIISPFSGFTGTSISFIPKLGKDTIMKKGVASPISTRHQCITCMIEYENKSPEELRLEDYQLNRKGPQQQSLFGPTISPFVQQQNLRAFFPESRPIIINEDRECPTCLKLKNKSKIETPFGHKSGKICVNKWLEQEEISGEMPNIVHKNIPLPKYFSKSESNTKANAHPRRRKKSSQNMGQNKSKSPRIKSDSELRMADEDRECPICLEIFNNEKIVTLCGHKFCKGCIYKWLDQGGGGKRKCPICNCEISRDSLKSATASKSNTKAKAHSRRIEQSPPRFNFPTLPTAAEAAMFPEPIYPLQSVSNCRSEQIPQWIFADGNILTESAMSQRRLPLNIYGPASNRIRSRNGRIIINDVDCQDGNYKQDGLNITIEEGIFTSIDENGRKTCLGGNITGVFKWNK